MSSRKTMKAVVKHNIPEDIWFEVLSRLPVKTLIRFHNVSKSWRALIDDPNFVRLQLTRFTNNRDESHLFVIQTFFEFECVVKCSKTLVTTSSLGFLESVSGSPQTLKTPPCKLDPSSNSKHWRVISSIDGLVLLDECLPPKTFFDRLSGLHNSIPNAMLWNPSIRKTRILPNALHHVPDNYFKSFYFGLGFDPLSKDYKVVRFEYVFKRHKTRRLIPYVHSAAIYTVRTNSWKTIDFEAKGWGQTYCLPSWNVPVCFRGVLYGFATDDRRPFMVSFDLNTEMFGSTALPVVYDHGIAPVFSLTMIDGGSSLALIDINKDSHGCVWVFDDIQLRSWTLRCTFVTTTPRPRFMYFKKNGELLLMCYSMVISYHTQSREEKILLEKGMYKRGWPYMESLILL